MVGGLVIPVASSGADWDFIDNVDRSRVFDNSYFASQAGTTKRDHHFSTPPVTRALAEIYASALNIVGPQVCSGDLLGGSENLVIQSEDFSGWSVDGTPVRGAADAVVGGVVLDNLSDDSAAALEGFKQNITFPTTTVKAVSLHVRQLSSSSSVFRLIEGGVNRLLVVLGWSAGLPAPTMTTGAFLGYDTLGSGVFRLKFSTDVVTASVSTEFDIYPASPFPFTVAPTGNLDVGGVQVENGSVPTPYIKTTTATRNTLFRNFCSEVINATPVKTSDGHRVVLSFVLHEQ